MTIQVTGILRSPTGTPLPNKDIRIISVVGSPLVLEGAFKIITTDTNGIYDFPLENGQYLIDVVYEDEAVIAGSSIVNVGTPTPVTLSELFLYTTPINPQQVIDLEATFQQLLDDLEDAFDTETQEIRTQLVDGDASTLQTAQTFTNDRLVSEMAVITATVTAGDASVTNVAKAYTDATGNLLAADITAVTTDTASVQVQLTATIDAQGVENALIRTELASGIATAISTTRTYSDTATGDLQVLTTALLEAGDATVLQTAGINATALNASTEAFLLDQIVVTSQGSVAGYQAYTIASLGFLDEGTGLWSDGPLSSSLRAHTVSTSDGDYASLTDVMQTFAKPDGSLVVNGSLISDVNGRITGYRHSNDGVTTDFQIIADDFAIGHMDGNTFVGDLTYDTNNQILQLSGDAIIENTLSATAIIADSITARELSAESIDAVHLSTDAIDAVDAQIANATITFAQIEDTLQSTNYSANTTGWRISKTGGFEANNALFRGTIESSYINGSFIEGGIIVGGTDFTVPTVTDTGSDPRYLAFADAIGSGNGSGIVGWSDPVLTLLASADYTEDGTVEYQEKTVYANFNRTIQHAVTGEGTLTLIKPYSGINYADSGAWSFMTVAIAATLDFHIIVKLRVYGYKKAGARTLLDTITIFDETKHIGNWEGINVVPNGTVTMSLDTQFTYNDPIFGDLAFYNVNSISVTIDTVPDFNTSGDYEKLGFEVFTESYSSQTERGNGAGQIASFTFTST